MAKARAILKNYRQSPRKVRVVADLIKGKPVQKALEQLDFAGKRAASPIKKLLESAIANAKNLALDEAKLIVESIRVDKGIVMKRMMPRARGRGFQILKRSSHVIIELAEGVTKAAKKAAKAAAKVEKTVKAVEKKVTKAEKADK